MEGVTGLRPTTWIAIGAGYSREDVKALFLARGESLVAEAVTNTQALAERVLAGAGPPQILEAVARQEVLRTLLAEPRIAATLPELKRLRRQGGFFRRLDQAVQGGRLAAAHAEETEVYCERLASRLGESPLRNEIRKLAAAYEAWLGAQGLWDPPMAIARATEILQTQGWPERGPRPERIVHLSLQNPESLEKSFFEALALSVTVERVEPELKIPAGPGDTPVQWHRWHTLDDACDELAETISAELARDPAALENHAVLIADSPTLRRSLKRALAQWRVPEADPRDPQRLKWDETIKDAMLPLGLLAGNFERTRVVAFLRAECARGIFPRSELDRFIAEINARGVRQGVQAYAAGKLAPVHARLEEIRGRFGGKKCLSEIVRAHLGWLGERASDGDWRVGFFEALWKDFSDDYERLGLSERSAPLLFWFERLQERLEQAPAPIERLKPRQGLRVYRLQQGAPLGLESVRTLWVVGMPSHWFSAEGVGDYWYSEREREVLASEFSVRSGMQVRQERLGAMRGWLARAGELRLLDAQYDSDGRERESVLSALREIGAGFAAFPEGPEDRGAHPRWLPSFGAFRPLPPQEISLGRLASGVDGSKPEISATTLEHYSRCPFQALAMDRWRLRDVREPEPELWPDVKGNLLHEAVKLLMKSRSAEGRFTLSCEQALEQAWRSKPPFGMIRSRRVEAYVRRRLLQVLEAFCVKEDEYFSRAGAEVVSLDEKRFRLELPTCVVVGQPDRIDRSSSGLFLMDYKTSSSLPNGTEMVELGYRLQLPFYALAASAEMSEPVLGVQFIELTNTARRSNGVFFERFNGKEPGKLTKLTRASRSLLKIEPEDAWSRLREHLEFHSSDYVGGRFAARPKKESKECARCSVADLCGFRRKVSDGLADAEGEVSDE